MLFHDPASDKSVFNASLDGFFQSKAWIPEIFWEFWPLFWPINISKRYYKRSKKKTIIRYKYNSQTRQRNQAPNQSIDREQLLCNSVNQATNQSIDRKHLLYDEVNKATNQPIDWKQLLYDAETVNLIEQKVSLLKICNNLLAVHCKTMHNFMMVCSLCG